MKTYDVCNDMSLELTTKEVPAGYKWVKRALYFKGQPVDMELGYCTRTKELHYIRTASDIDLSGEEL